MLEKWPVIACDQYTQDKLYWEKVNNFVDSAPSTLRLILPEVYLDESSKESRIEKIQLEMNKYLKSNVFNSPLSAMIYLERKTAYNRIRKGLITCIDLDSYEWKPFSHAKIRATEATIVERIPPRMKIRQGASLESPHIMLLVNDPDKNLIEKTGELAKKENKYLYNIDLMMKSGNISGWKVSNDNAEIEKNILAALATIKEKNTDDTNAPFMFAVGDGNHSLATAKAVWEDYNTFEPIHRVLYNVNNQALISFIQKKLNATIKEYKTANELEKIIKESIGFLGFVYIDANSRSHYICLETNITELAISRLQPVIDMFLDQTKTNSATTVENTPSIDYIHGSDEVFRLGKEKNALTILLPPIAKESFFQTIAHLGPLPRKSFSMGEASEKRFYMECRKLFAQK